MKARFVQSHPLLFSLKRLYSGGYAALNLGYFAVPHCTLPTAIMPVLLPVYLLELEYHFPKSWICLLPSYRRANLCCLSETLQLTAHRKDGHWWLIF